jgi:hypothetical protein
LSFTLLTALSLYCSRYCPIQWFSVCSLILVREFSRIAVVDYVTTAKQNQDYARQFLVGQR